MWSNFDVFFFLGGGVNNSTWYTKPAIKLSLRCLLLWAFFPPIFFRYGNLNLNFDCVKLDNLYGMLNRSKFPTIGLLITYFTFTFGMNLTHRIGIFRFYCFRFRHWFKTLIGMKFLLRKREFSIYWLKSTPEQCSNKSKLNGKYRLCFLGVLSMNHVYASLRTGLRIVISTDCANIQKYFLQSVVRMYPSA